MSSPPVFVAHDAEFARVSGGAPRLERLMACPAHEGPVYLAGEHALLATSLPDLGSLESGRSQPGPAAAILRIDLDGDRFPVAAERIRVLATPAVMPNGMSLDTDGNLVVCEQGDARNHACISRIDPSTGERRVVVDQWRGRRFNSPNDVAVDADGAIWFTDPSYGHLQGFRPPPEVGDFVYRWDPATGDADVVADGFDKPNGIALSPDGATLYVTDSGANQAAGSFHPERPHHVVAFDVLGGRRLGGRRLVAVTAPGFPDGLKVDAGGRLYVSSPAGVLVLSPDGRLLGEIRIPGTVNFTFGGPGGNVLYVTADDSVWAATLVAAGPAARAPAITAASLAASSAAVPTPPETDAAPSDPSITGAAA